MVPSANTGQNVQNLIQNYNNDDDQMMDGDGYWLFKYNMFARYMQK